MHAIWSRSNLLLLLDLVMLVCSRHRFPSNRPVATYTWRSINEENNRNGGLLSEDRWREIVQPLLIILQSGLK